MYHIEEEEMKKILADPVRRKNFLDYRNRCQRGKVILTIVYLALMFSLLFPYFYFAS